MKKKIWLAVVIALLILPVLIVVGYYIIYYTCNLALLDIHKKINSHFDVNISTEWEMKFATTEFKDAWLFNTDYYVFVVDSENQEFFEDFSQDKNEEFEEEIMSWSLDNKRMGITEEFSFDLTKPYSWYKRDDYKYEGRFIYFVYQGDRLYTIASWAYW